MEKGDLEEFWTHLAARASCTREPSSDWTNPHSHPGNDDRLGINSSHFFIKDMCFGKYILIIPVRHKGRKTSAKNILAHAKNHN